MKPVKHSMEYQATRFSTQAVGVDVALRPIPPEHKRGEREWSLVSFTIVGNTEVIYMWRRSTRKKRKRLPFLGELW